MSKITVLSITDRIAAFYSLYPFFMYGDRHTFTYTASPEFCLEKDTNEILIMMRQFIKPDRVDLSLMEGLRKKYRTIAFFHDDAGGGIPRLEVLPYVDLFYTKALFKDKSLYTKQLYGKELYSDYYHQKYGVTDDKPKTRAVLTDISQLQKLRLSWNVGVGDFPREKIRQRAGTAAARLFGMPSVRLFYSRKRISDDPLGQNSGIYDIHARIGLASQRTINFQRDLILKKIEGDRRFLTGEVSQAQYNRELTQSKIALSPFGWGELCIRDFEAVRAGALLMKPSMDHLETWPDVFIKNETYVPFSWDADDLLPLCDDFLHNDVKRKNIARRAYDVYVSQLRDLPERFRNILSEINGL
ncbi:glycosyltransferase family 1 protein [Treponema sp. OttesenSCG-928-L16]|nr:glycosyltransferase family 1 protein [Treponema sp. OttesenSCG-928-L16]